MYRQIYRKLQAWKSAKKRKPLILKGVRQCGKTFCLQKFGHDAFPKTHYLNLEDATRAHEIFNQDLDPTRIINELSFYLDTTINTQTDFVIFDEIQACPRALTSLKYFCEKLPELALASAGSLLGLQLNPSSFPVGKVDLLHLHPLSFIEFLHALNDKKSANIIENYQLNTTIPTIIHEHLWEQLKWYFIVGGLPEVVRLFCHEKDKFIAAKQVREKQSQLIYAYYADIAKHSGKTNALQIDRIWNAIPKQLVQTHNSSANRFRFKDIVPGIDRYSRLVNAFDWLVSAELVIQVPIVNIGEIPLNAYTEESKFKLFMFDIGILGAMNNLSPKTILDYDYGTYKGYFAENFAAQQFVTTNQIPYSWQRQRAEVEFLIEKEGSIIPIEVKSGWITKAQSLQTYSEKYNPPYKMVLSAKETYTDSKTKTHFVPLYLAEII